MKRKIRVGERYALFTPSDRRSDDNQWQRHTGIACCIYQIITQGIISTRAIYKYCIYAGRTLRKLWRIPSRIIERPRQKNIEESCVCTHAKAPARSGLGFALGSLLLFLFYGGTVNAQFYQPSEMTVGVGETLPETFFETNHQAVNMRTGEETTLQMEDYRDKLIILDFWATWCGPCIYSLNKLDSISRDLPDDGYVIIPVTYQPSNEASVAYNKYRWDFTSIVGDTVLGSVFPYRGLPHMVWVKDGRVVSMPQSSYVEKETISAMLNGELWDMPQQLKDINTSQPMVSRSEQTYSGTLLYQSSIIGGDAAFAQRGITVEEHDGYLVLTMCNMPLLGGLVFEAFDRNYPSARLSRKQIVWDMDSISKTKYIKPKPRHTDFDDLRSYYTAYERWVANHMYSYSLKMPAATGREELFEVMKRDVCLFMAARGLEVSIETGTEATLVIREKQKSSDLN